MKKFLIIALFSICLISMNSVGYAETNEETLKEQQEEFKIKDFINETKKYEGEFFENVDIGEVLEDAIKGNVDNSKFAKRIIDLLGEEVTININAIISILVIIIIHSILKSISDSLENDSVSKLVYYVQYILIVTIIMSNFTDVAKLVEETTRKSIRVYEYFSTSSYKSYALYRKHNNKYTNRTNYFVFSKFYR